MPSKSSVNAVDNQYLPEAKEKQFQTIVSAYEKLEWTKGLKLIEPLLKEFPENGKIISMKTIMKFNVDSNKEEAEAGLKRGILLGRRSSLCWHLYGIYQRSQKKYVEAKKSFQFAHSLDPNNIQIIIDLADLQIQVRDYSGFRVSKQKLMNERSTNNAYWLGFITGAYLDKKYDLCLEIITAFRKTLECTPTYTRQELVLLEVECRERLGEDELAAVTLEKRMCDVFDEDAAKERLAIIYGRLGKLCVTRRVTRRLNRSETLWRELLCRNSENFTYFRGLECCILKCFVRFDSMKALELPSAELMSADERQRLRAMYTELKGQFPRSNAIRSIELWVCDGDDFLHIFDALLLNAVRKGIPSFFNSIKRLLRQIPTKFIALRSLSEGHLKMLQYCGRLTADGGEEEPCVELWLLLLLAQIEDFSGHYEVALQYLQTAFKHTPTCYDMYIIKAKVLKHAGYLLQSADALGFGSSLDLGDRHMNTKHVKYLLRSNQIEEADTVVSYWTRKDVPSRVDLSFLQACWFEVECADSYLRQGDIPHANKLYRTVLDHFSVFVDDQFDFHGYVMRKATIMAYIKFLRFVDHLAESEFYRRAATGAIRCSIALSRKHIDVAEYKTTFTMIEMPTVHKKGAEYIDDTDPNGIKMATCEKPLDVVATAATQLLLFAADDLNCMRAVLEWGLEMNDTKICVETTSNLLLKCNSPAAALLAVSQMKSKSMECDSVFNEKTEKDAMAEIDLSSMLNRVLLAEYWLFNKNPIKCLNTIISEWESIKVKHMDDFISAYSLIKHVGPEETADFVTKAKVLFPGFEESIKLLCYVC